MIEFFQLAKKTINYLWLCNVKLHSALLNFDTKYNISHYIIFRYMTFWLIQVSHLKLNHLLFNFDLIFIYYFDVESLSSMNLKEFQFNKMIWQKKLILRQSTRISNLETTATLILFIIYCPIYQIENLFNKRLQYT